jgi:hypothetical protein
MSAGSTREYRSYGVLGAAWAGVEPLWLVFWVYGAVGGNLIGYAFEKITSPWAVLVLIVPAIAYYVWINVSIWRCAANSSPIWKFLARATVVFTVLMIPWWIWNGIHEST